MPISRRRGRGPRTVLLDAGIPVVEHLTGPNAVPPVGARFSALPPRITGLGTFPVRAYACFPADPATVAAT